MGILLFLARRRGLWHGSWKPVTPAKVLRLVLGGLGGVGRGDGVGRRAGMRGMKRGVPPSSSERTVEPPRGGVVSARLGGVGVSRMNSVVGVSATSGASSGAASRPGGVGEAIAVTGVEEEA